jgi:hypothetical protein
MNISFTLLSPKFGIFSMPFTVRLVRSQTVIIDSAFKASFTREVRSSKKFNSKDSIHGVDID